MNLKNRFVLVLRLAAPVPEQEPFTSIGEFEMTNNSSSNNDIDFPIPKEIRDYYEYEFVCVINKKKQFVEIIRESYSFFKLSLSGV